MNPGIAVVAVLTALVGCSAITPPVQTQKAQTQTKADTKKDAEKRDIVVTRSIDAPIDLVWKAWTDCEHVMRWWGPTGFTSPSCRMDFREGGKFIWHMRAPKEMGGSDFYTAGVYKKIVPMQLIEFDQGLCDKDGNRIDPTSVGMPPDFPKEIPSALTFKRVGGKTELTATEYGWTVGPMPDLSELGLRQSLDKLVELAESR